MNGRYIGSWVLVIALAFVIVSVLFTNNLSRQLALEEQKNVAIWAEATRQLILADEDTDINFVSSIIEKNTNIFAARSETTSSSAARRIRDTWPPVSEPWN